MYKHFDPSFCLKQFYGFSTWFQSFIYPIQVASQIFRYDKCFGRQKPTVNFVNPNTSRHNAIMLLPSNYLFRWFNSHYLGHFRGFHFT